MTLIKNRFANRLEDTIYEVVFPKAKRDRFRGDKFEFGMMENSATKLTNALKTEILKLVLKQIPTKERIIEVLNKYLTNEMYTEDVNIKGIANEILGDDKNV